MYIYIYIYIQMYICTCICICIYTHTYRRWGGGVLLGPAGRGPEGMIIYN